MRILIIGVKGNIGSIISPAIQQTHEVLTAGRTSGDLQADLSSAQSIAAMFSQTGAIDGCICVAGDSYSGDLWTMTDEELNLGIRHKLLGQINLVRLGTAHLKDGGFFILTSGKMGDEPALHTSAKALVNGV